MTIPDETLMAYADGELDPAARAAVESAMREDPQLEKRVAQHRALRQRVRAAYSTELSWQIQTLTQEPGNAAGESAYRTARSPMSATILKSVEGQITPEPLDQAGEKVARQRGWQVADRELRRHAP
jgi:anti-sigma factor RsiW